MSRFDCKSPSFAVSSCLLLTNMKWEVADPAWSTLGPCTMAIDETEHQDFYQGSLSIYYSTTTTITSTTTICWVHHINHCPSFNTWLSGLPAPDNRVIEPIDPKTTFHILTILSIWGECMENKTKKNKIVLFLYLKCVCGGTICFTICFNFNLL